MYDKLCLCRKITILPLKEFAMRFITNRKLIQIIHKTKQHGNLTGNLTNSRAFCERVLFARAEINQPLKEKLMHT